MEGGCGQERLEGKVFSSEGVLVQGRPGWCCLGVKLEERAFGSEGNCNKSVGGKDVLAKGILEAKTLASKGAWDGGCLGAKQFRSKSICREKAFGERAFREKNIWQLERLDVRVFWGERVSVLFPAPKWLLWSPGSLCAAAVGQREHKPHPAPPASPPTPISGPLTPPRSLATGEQQRQSPPCAGRAAAGHRGSGRAGGAAGPAGAEPPVSAGRRDPGAGRRLRGRGDELPPLQAARGVQRARGQRGGVHSPSPPPRDTDTHTHNTHGTRGGLGRGSGRRKLRTYPGCGEVSAGGLRQGGGLGGPLGFGGGDP